MPTTYAHWRFGDKGIKTLPEDLQKIINNNREIFDFGVHGPDIFFYYNALKFNDINKYGHKLHNIPFKETLEKIKPLYKTCDDKDAALSYLLGFVAHFTLDSYCHGYIDLVAESGIASHGKIESQLDRYFLIKDGYDPNKQSVTFSLKPSNKLGHVIGQLFPEQGEEICTKCIKDQLLYLNLLRDDSKLKRAFLITVMDAVGVKSFKELLLTDKNDPRCKATSERLNKYFKVANRHYPILAMSLVKYLNDEEELDPYYHNHFNPKEDYKEIPIYDYDDEIQYEVNDFQK